MHESAANKLLKLIEEPPERSVIILVSEKPENILLTIRSRTQMIKLQPLADELVAERIQGEYQLEAQHAKDLARIMNGNLSRALSAAENGNVNQWFSLFRDWMRVCYTADVMKLIPWVDQINTFGREEQRNFLSYSVEVLRQCLTGNYTSGELQRFAEDELGFAKKFGPFINHTNGPELLNEFQQAYRDIRGNMNAKLVFFDLSIRVHKLLRKSKLSA
jgi:DNA polymerase-3 subunit delta'